jgi:glucokinase
MTETILAGDIGGTKTVLGLYSSDQGPHHPLEEATYPSNDFDSLEEIVQQFLAGHGMPITRASIDVAGPVFGGRSQITNLKWSVDSESIGRLIGAPVTLLNDLYAISRGIPALGPGDQEILVAGVPEPRGTIGVIAPGTGLGEGFLVWTEEGYCPYPSEGGHASFGPETPLELELLNFLWPMFSHVSYERVCSGLGLPNIYAFLKDGKGFPEPDWLRQELDEASHPTPVIVRAALENKAEICTRTVDLFISILGSEAGNLALKVLATGGIYLGGGIPPRILTYLRKEIFASAFINKGRFAGVLTRVPVSVILHPQAALFGSACHALAWQESRG